METLTYPRTQVRVSDADRDRAIAELSEHFGAGRLTKEEFDERTGQALQARTSQDLAALFTDLPRNSRASTGVSTGQRRPAEPYHAPIPRIAVVACGIVVAVSVLGGVSSGHHAVFGLAPVLIVLLVVRVLFLRRRDSGQRFR
jgi:hypothetical protein